MAHSVSEQSIAHPQNQLIQLISDWIAPLGYQVVHLEIQSHRQKTLRVFIDFLNSSESKAIGIEDCVQVSRFLDEKLDQSLEVESVLSGAYELEVSSPGVDRPLRTSADFERFKGKQVRIHVFRPLNSGEIENTEYAEKNPKQKNFLGILKGLQESKVVLSLPISGKDLKQAKKKGQTKKDVEPITNSEEGVTVRIPLPLISKAHLEPDFDFESGNERESLI